MSVYSGPGRLIQPLQGGEKDFDSRAAASIWATMLFPRDDQTEDRFATSVFYAARQTLLTGNTSVPGAWAEERVLDRASLFQIVRFGLSISGAEVLSRAERGTVAGEILSLCVLLDLHAPTTASLNRAIFLAEDRYRYGDRKEGSRRLSHSTISRIWSEYWPVSHLWAGFAEQARELERVARSKEDASFDLALDCMMRNPRPMCSYSVGYLKHATTIVPLRKKSATPVVNWKEAWLPPYELVIQQEAELYDPATRYKGLSDEAAEVLKRYREG